MRVIIAGSRHYQNYEVVEQAIVDSGFNVTEVVFGGSRGVDKLGLDWAIKHGVTVKTFLADWERHGKGGGPIRNTQMASYADALILVWNGISHGSADMKRKAEKRKLLIYEKKVKFELSL